MSTSTQPKQNDSCTTENHPEAPAYQVRPRVDVVELESHYEMMLEIPGVKREDLDVTLEKDVLSVSGIARFEIPEGMHVSQNANRPRCYTRSFRLSDEIDQSGITVEAKDGVAYFKLPKSLKAKKTKLEVN